MGMGMGGLSRRGGRTPGGPRPGRESPSRPPVRLKLSWGGTKRRGGSGGLTPTHWASSDIAPLIGPPRYRAPAVERERGKRMRSADAFSPPLSPPFSEGQQSGLREKGAGGNSFVAGAGFSLPLPLRPGAAIGIPSSGQPRLPVATLPAGRDASPAGSAQARPLTPSDSPGGNCPVPDRRISGRGGRPPPTDGSVASVPHTHTPRALLRCPLQPLWVPTLGAVLVGTRGTYRHRTLPVSLRTGATRRQSPLIGGPAGWSGCAEKAASLPPTSTPQMAG